MLLSGCLESSSLPPATHREVILATARPLEDSGLVEQLIAAFKRDHPLTPVQVLAVGSPRAIDLAQSGEVDVIFTHLPGAEKGLVDEGDAVGRWEIMYDDYLLVGPGSDPAKAGAAPSVVQAFRRVGKGMHSFVTRGDGSGTHRRELDIWAKTDVVLASSWYLTARRGAAEILAVASERGSYTLVDRATLLANADGLNVVTLFENDPVLGRNLYSVLLVSAERHPGANQVRGQVFVDWLVSAAGRKAVADFGREQWGRAPYTLMATSQ